MLVKYSLSIDNEFVSKRNLIFIIAITFISIIVVSVGSVYFYTGYCEWAVPAKSEFGKSPIRDKGKVHPGFMLFLSLNLSGIPFDHGTVYLTNLYGKVVHKWRTHNRALYSILKPDGNLLVSQVSPIDKEFPQTARITSIQELNEKSEVVWEYKNGAMHHDFDLLPNGNIAVLEWVKIPREMHLLIRGGRSGTEFNKQEIFTDRILEVNKS